MKVDIEGSNRARDSLLQNFDQPKMRERELAKNSTEIDELKRLNGGNAELYA